MKNRVENVFVADLLELSPKAAEYVDVLWTIHKMSIPVPLKFISFYFGECRLWEVENKIKILSEAKLITWFGRGKFDVDSFGKLATDLENTEIFLQLNEGLNTLISDKKPMTKDAFREIVFEYAGNDIMFYCRNQLTDFLITALQKIILDAEPVKPMFIGKLIRDLCDVWRISSYECRQILYYYMNKFLDLIKVEDGIFVNLSEKSVEKVGRDPELFKIYIKEYKPEPIRIEKPETQVPKWDYEKLKQIRQYFPWVGTA